MSLIPSSIGQSPPDTSEAEPLSLFSLASRKAIVNDHLSPNDQTVASQNSGLKSLRETLELRLQEVSEEAQGLFPTFRAKDIGQKISAPVRYIVLSKLIQVIKSIISPPALLPLPSNSDPIVQIVDKHVHSDWVERAVSLRADIAQRAKAHVSRKRLEWYTQLVKSGLNRGAGQIQGQALTWAAERVDNIVSIAELVNTAHDVVENICSTAFGVVWFTLKEKEERAKLLE